MRTASLSGYAGRNVAWDFVLERFNRMCKQALGKYQRGARAPSPTTAGGAREDCHRLQQALVWLQPTTPSTCAFAPGKCQDASTATATISQWA